MEIEKKLTVAASRERVWQLLLDPHVMTGAVPGMQSIDVISPTEYVALMKVKISFISAKFKLHTHIVEQREPEYLRAEGTGEDASVASSLKQTSEIFLASTPDGGTELRIKVNVDVLGRLGTFGLSVMKTKADRMWEEFGANLAKRIDGGDAVQGEVTAGRAQKPEESRAAEAVQETSTVQPAHEQRVAPQTTAEPDSDFARVVENVAASSTAKESPGWLSRLLGKSQVTTLEESSNACIRVEVRQLDRTVTVEWPSDAADQCQDWLKELLGK